MTALLKIKRARVINPGKEILITALKDIEDFSLVIAETSATNFYQGTIQNKNSSIILTTPELDFDSCIKKIYQMINSLGKLISADEISPEIDLQPLLKNSLAKNIEENSIK